MNSRAHWLWLAAIVVALVSVPGSKAGADDYRNYPLTITGSITTAAKATVAIFFDGSTFAWDCSAQGPTPIATTLCTASPFEGAAPRSARIEVRAAGYKRFAKNIPLLQFDGPEASARVDLGAITLTPTELPSVEQVIQSRGKDQSYRFEITLKNPLKKAFLIREVVVLGVKVNPEHDPNLSCCCPPSAEFRLSDALYVTVARSGKLVASGTFEETKRSAGYTTEATGTITQHGCGDDEWLELHLAASIQLPATAEIAVLVHLPRRFKIVESGWRGADQPLPAPDTSLVDDADTGRSDYFNFKFITTDENELPILSSYMPPRASPPVPREKPLRRIAPTPQR